MAETDDQRSIRILSFLKSKYPSKKCYDLDGRTMHFVCEIEPVEEHPEYDRAVEVILRSTPHKHLKMRQVYTILFGNLKFHCGEQEITLHQGDTYANY